MKTKSEDTMEGKGCVYCLEYHHPEAPWQGSQAQHDYTQAIKHELNKKSAASMSEEIEPLEVVDHVGEGCATFTDVHNSLAPYHRKIQEIITLLNQRK